MNKEENDFLEQYNSLKDSLNQWGQYVDTKLQELIKELIETNKVILLPKYRLKNDASIISKVFYREKNYSNPLFDLTDKVGTRIVLLTMLDVERVATIIKSFNEWDCECTRDIKNDIDDNPNLFDYQSIHIVVWPKIPINNSIDQDHLLSLKCEIQIRTLLQHAYAEISHDNCYKGPYKSNKKILRQLSKSMALMESADDYFCNIYNLMTNKEENKDLEFLNCLEDIFKRKISDNPTNDVELSESLFMFCNKEMPISISEIESFIDKTPEVITQIKTNKSYIFKNPIIFLLAYYCYNHRTLLIKKWEISHDALNIVLQGFGYSTGTY